MTAAAHIGESLVAMSKVKQPRFLNRASSAAVSAPIGPNNQIASRKRVSAFAKSLATRTATHQRGTDSALSRTVLHVVGMGAQEKMGWVCARRVVAVVTNFHANRNRAVKKSPSVSMRGNFALRIIELIADDRHAIATVVSPTQPRPARVHSRGFVDLRPKTFERDRSGSSRPSS